MIKRKADKIWFPWWPEKWLWGTIRIECTPAERGIWVDLLSLASKDDGYIRANEDIPYPLKQLAGMLILPEKELNDTVNKFIRIGKLKQFKNGTLYVIMWEKYQFSERHKRRIEEGRSEKEDIGDKKSALKNSIIEYSKVNYNKEEQKINLTTEQEKEIYEELRTVKGLGDKKIATIIQYLRELSIEFPEIDYVFEMKKKCTWWRDNPLNKKSNIHLQIRNWFTIVQKGFNDAEKQLQVGRNTGKARTKYPTEFLNNVYIVLRKQMKDKTKYSKLLYDVDYYQAKQLAIKYQNNPEGFIKFLEEE